MADEIKQLHKTIDEQKEQISMYEKRLRGLYRGDSKKHLFPCLGGDLIMQPWQEQSIKFSDQF